jgi:hypothetical protein
MVGDVHRVHHVEAGVLEPRRLLVVGHRLHDRLGETPQIEEIRAHHRRPELRRGSGLGSLDQATDVVKDPGDEGVIGADRVSRHEPLRELRREQRLRLQPPGQALPPGGSARESLDRHGQVLDGDGTQVVDRLQQAGDPARQAEERRVHHVQQLCAHRQVAFDDRYDVLHRGVRPAHGPAERQVGAGHWW